MKAHLFTHFRRSPLAIAAGLFFAGASLVTGQTTYTWFAYDNTTANSSIVADWNLATNWDADTIFSNGILNELMFFNDGDGSYTYATGDTRLEQEGTLTIQNVPDLTTGILTLDGRGPNNSNSTFVNIGDNSATWTIGDGTSGTINLNSISGGGGDRYVNYTVNPNITLNGNLTVNGGSDALRGAVFTGNFTDGGSGYGITKIGDSRLVLSGTNTYSGDTVIDNGFIRFSNPGSLSSSTNLTLDGGMAEMSGDFTRTLGTNSGEIQFTSGNSGFSARDNRLNITLNNDASHELVWGGTHFNLGTFRLNNNTADAELTLNNNIDLNGSNRTVQVDASAATLSGVIRTSSGTAGITKNGAGTLHLTGSNTYNGNTTLNSGTLSIETSDNAGIGGSIIFNNGTLGIRGNTLTDLSGLGHSATLVSGRHVGFNIYDSSHTFTVDQALTQGSGRLYKYGPGTLVLNQANTFTGETQAYGGGNLVLDYFSQDNSKLSDTNRLYLGGSTVTLSGGTHAEDISSLTLQDRTANTITQTSGTSTINLNGISRGNRSTLHLTADGIATTDQLNDATKGIIGAWLTVGSHWGINSTNTADGSIIAYSAYTPFVTSGGSSNNNYELQGSAALTGNISMNTLRIEGTAGSETLDIGNRTVSIQSFTNSRGGILYAGGGTGNYTITGTTGRLTPANGNGQSLLINTYAGKLTVDANLSYGSSGLTKTGEGILALGGTNSYSGQSDIMQGGLLVDGTTTTSTFVINAGARVGGSGTIGGNLTLIVGSDFIFNPTDPLIVSGLVTLDDTFGIDNLVNEDGSDVDWSLVANGTYTLIDNVGDFSNIENFGIDNAVDIGSGRNAYFQNGSLQLVVIPEPSSFLLMALSSLLLARRRRA